MVKLCTSSADTVLDKSICIRQGIQLREIGRVIARGVRRSYTRKLRQL